MFQQELYKKTGLILLSFFLVQCFRQVRLPADCVLQSIAVKYIDKIPVITVKTSLTGNKKLHLAIDTGASFSMIRYNDRIASGQEPVLLPMMISTVGPPRHRDVYLYKGDISRRGEILFKSVNIYSYNTNLNVDGMIGLPELLSRRIIFDLPRRIILPGENCRPDWTSVGYTIKDKRIYISAEGGTVKEMFLVDSGAGLSVLPIQKDQYQCDTGETVFFRDLSGTRYSAIKCKMEKFCLNNECIEGVDFIIPEKNDAITLDYPVLGANILKEYWFMADPSEKLIYYRKKQWKK